MVGDDNLGYNSSKLSFGEVNRQFYGQKFYFYGNESTEP